MSAPPTPVPMLRTAVTSSTQRCARELAADWVSFAMHTGPARAAARSVPTSVLETMPRLMAVMTACPCTIPAMPTPVASGEASTAWAQRPTPEAMAAYWSDSEPGRRIRSRCRIRPAETRATRIQVPPQSTAA